MKRISKITLIFCTLLVSSLCISWEVNNARLLKKVDKQIASVWKKSAPQKHEIKLVSEEPSAENRQFFKLVANDSICGYAVLNRSYGCRVGGCAVYTTSNDKSGTYDPFYYSIVTDQNFIIKNVQVLEFYSEYGYQITNKKWLAQFIGLDGFAVEYDKDVDAISSATISVKSLIDDVEIACKMLHEIDSKRLTSE